MPKQILNLKTLRRLKEGDTSTLVADCGFHGLTDPENFCIGSL